MSKSNHKNPHPAPDLDSLPRGRYYSIKEAADLFGLEQHTLRYWERFTPLSPKRMPSGARYYDIEQLRLIERIHFLTEVKGMTIQKAAERLAVGEVDVDLEIRRRLSQVRTRLASLRDRLGEVYHLEPKKES